MVLPGSLTTDSTRKIPVAGAAEQAYDSLRFCRMRNDRRGVFQFSRRHRRPRQPSSCLYRPTKEAGCFAGQFSIQRLPEDAARAPCGFGLGE